MSSRAYLIQKDRLVQVTKDLFREMADTGIIGPDEAFNHPMKNLGDWRQGTCQACTL